MSTIGQTGTTAGRIAGSSARRATGSAPASRQRARGDRVAPIAVARKERGRASSRAPHDRRDDRALAARVLVVALAWLVFGCCGLLWTIAFTADPRSMVIGLAVWVFCFVAPSTLATVVACRLDESHGDARVRGHESPASSSAGD
jgi:hypothetical protein